MNARRRAETYLNADRPEKTNLSTRRRSRNRRAASTGAREPSAASWPRRAIESVCIVYRKVKTGLSTGIALLY